MLRPRRQESRRSSTFLTGAVLLLVSTAIASEPPVPCEEEVRAFFSALEARFDARDLDSLLELYADDFEGDFGLTTKATLRARLEALFERHAYTRFQVEIAHLDVAAPFAGVGVTARLEYGGASDAHAEVSDSNLWILEKDGGRLLARARYPADPRGWKGLDRHRYRSDSGGFAIDSPPEWFVFVPREAPSRLVFDLVWLVHPRTGSIAGVAVVDLPPREVSAHQLARIDLEASGPDLRELTGFGETTVDGVPGWQTTLVDRTTGSEYRIRRISVVRGGLYYNLYFQSPSDESLAPQGADVDRMFEGFAFTDARPDRPGSVQDGRFVSNDPRCEVRIPEGWRAAPTASRYLFRAVLVPPEPGSDSLVQFFAQPCGPDEDATAALRAYVESVVVSLEASVPGTRRLEEARPIKTEEAIGWSIRIELPASSLARTRRIVAFARDGIRYVFYCDAIPPERYVDLESGFDAIVESLRFR